MRALEIMDKDKALNIILKDYKTNEITVEQTMKAIEIIFTPKQTRAEYKRKMREIGLVKTKLLKPTIRIGRTDRVGSTNGKGFRKEPRPDEEVVGTDKEGKTLFKKK